MAALRAEICRLPGSAKPRQASTHGRHRESGQGVSCTARRQLRRGVQFSRDSSGTPNSLDHSATRGASSVGTGERDCPSRGSPVDGGFRGSPSKVPLVSPDPGTIAAILSLLPSPVDGMSRPLAMEGDRQDGGAVRRITPARLDRLRTWLQLHAPDAFTSDPGRSSDSRSSLRPAFQHTGHMTTCL